MKVMTIEGGVALCDDEDFEVLSRHRWFLRDGYAVKRGGERNISMHRFLMKAQAGQSVDHIDRNRSNNQKSNLRFATSAENQRNRGRGIRSKNNYKQVFFASNLNKW